MREFIFKKKIVNKIPKNNVSLENDIISSLVKRRLVMRKVSKI